MNSDAAIESQAAAWIAQKDAGLSAEGHSELAEWLKTDPRHAAAFNRLTAAWRAIERPRSTGSVDRLLGALQQRQMRRRRRYFALASCAILIAAGSLAALRRSAQPREADEIVALAPRKEALPDGSIVELRGAADIQVDYSAGDRRILLKQGEALFKVAKNPARPFIVRANSVDVRAVGTEFIVQLGSKSVEVVVTEGTVAVDRAPSAESSDRGLSPIYVKAGNRLAVPTSAGAVEPVAQRVPPNEMDRLLGWSHPRYEFSATPLAEVIEVLNRSSMVKVRLGDPSLAEIRVGGSFRADDTDEFLHVLNAGFGIDCQWVSEREVILRKSF